MRSLRRRLLVVTLLTAAAFVIALGAVVHLAWLGRAQRIERAQDLCDQELDRLTDAQRPAHRPHPPHMPRMPWGPPRGGRLDAQLREVDGDSLRDRPTLAALRDDVAREALATRRRVLREREVEGRRAMSLVIAADVTSDGGAAWVLVAVPQAPGAPWLRVAVALLTLATLGAVVLSVRTLRRFGGDVTGLQGSLQGLTRDLSAPVSEPSLAELAALADVIRGMSRALHRSQDERTRLERALAQQERLAGLGRVASGVAHEVRNPLASIKLKVDLARMAHPGDDALSQDLSDVSDEVARLDRLVVDLLVLAGRRDAPRAHASLGALVRQRVEMIAPWAAERGVTVTGEGDASAEVDRDGITRVVDNLLRNAVEASPQGGAVTVATRASGGRVEVVVTDRGEGVTAARERELFEPFFTTKSEGTGLGLALSRAVAMAHGGTIRYERDGGATRFTVELPEVAVVSDGDDPGGR